MSEPAVPRNGGASTRWSLAFRLARREVRRHPWRHALVVIMITLPVLAAIVAFSTVSTVTWFDVAKQTHQSYGSDLYIAPWASEHSGPGWTGIDDDSLDKVRATLPAGSRAATSWTSVDWLSTERERPDGQGPVLIGSVVTTSPGPDDFGERFRVDAGLAPEDEGDIFLTRDLADLGGWQVGDVIESGRDERSFTVSGMGVARDDVAEPLAVTGSLPDSYWVSRPSGYDAVVMGDPSTGSTMKSTMGTGWAAWVVDPGGWREVRSLEAERHTFVWLPPGADADAVARSLSDLYVHPEVVGSSPAARILGPVMVMVFGALSAIVAIVASAAFAIASRRQLRSVGLLSTAGADPATIRSALVLQGAIPGLAAATIALALGVLGAWYLGSGGVLESLTGLEGAKVVLSVGGMLLAVVLGVGAGTLAAWWPARAASRVPVLSALAGRRPIGPVPTNVPLTGLVSAVVGAAGLAAVIRGSAVAGAGSPLVAISPLLVLAAFLAMLFGMVALAPTLVATVGLLSTRVTGTARIALRGIARHRSQSAAAVAAVAICLAVPVGVLTTRDAFNDQGWLERDVEWAVGAAEVDDTAPDAVPGTTDAGPRSSSVLADPESAVVARGDLRSAHLDRAIAEIEQVTGPVARVPFVAFGDGGGGWQIIAALDPASAGDLVVPWVAEQLNRGGAVALTGAPGELVVDDDVSRVTLDAVGAPGTGSSFLSEHADADYLVPASIFEEVGAGRPPINMLLVPHDGLDVDAARAVQAFDSDVRWSGRTEAPTLTELREALRVTATDTQGPSPIVEPSGIWFEVTPSALGFDTSAEPVLDGSRDVDGFRRWLTVVALVAATLSLLVLTVTLLLRSVDSVDDHRAAIAAGASPDRMRRQRSIEGMVLASLGAVLAIPLGWLPVTAWRFGQFRSRQGDESALAAFTSRLHVPGWEIIPILVLPILVVGVAWLVAPWLRSLTQRGPVDQVLPRH